MKKFISTLLVAAMLITAIASMGISVSAETAEAIAISTADELLAIAAQFEDGNFKGDYYLANDIDLGGKAFSQYVFKHFNGTLDGKGHKIYNFSFDGSNATNANAGFFSWFGNSADTTVKNLNIGDATKPISYKLKVAENGGSAKYFSFFACEPGNNNSAVTVTVEGVNIYAKAELVTDDASPKFNFGGLFGFTRAKDTNYIVKNCTVNGEINAVTGITAGTNYINIGGFVGAETSKKPFTIENCTNNANITLGCSTKEARATGFVAYDQNGALTIKNCVNTGKVTILGDTADTYVAGFVGDVNNADGTTLINCINAGELAGANRVAGMIALVRDGKTATVTDCANYGKYTATATAAAANIGEGAANATVTGFSDKTGTTYPEPSTTEPGKTEPTGDSAWVYFAFAALAVIGTAVVAKKKEN